jgi:DNA-binding MarR family transcriptional regulator
MSRLGLRVAGLMTDLPGRGARLREVPRPPIGRVGEASRVRRYLRVRQQRGALLGSNLFADPAWDILLDLYANELLGRTVSVSSACIASGVPSTTALRWIDKMLRQRIIERVADRDDKRRTFLRLTPEASEAVQRWVAAALAD